MWTLFLIFLVFREIRLLIDAHNQFLVLCFLLVVIVFGIGY